MMKRLKLATRILLGLPLWGVPIDELTMVEDDEESEFDYTKGPPFALVFGDLADHAPPVKIIRKDRFRVCIFLAKRSSGGCEKPIHWLVLELEGHEKWHHLVTMQESRLDVMLPVLRRAAAFVESPEMKKPLLEELS